MLDNQEFVNALPGHLAGDEISKLEFLWFSEP
jgi:hypothetical protein